jgi:hypothetical protein
MGKPPFDCVAFRCLLYHAFEAMERAELMRFRKLTEKTRNCRRILVKNGGVWYTKFGFYEWTEQN